jgi:hypothetical protein
LKYRGVHREWSMHHAIRLRLRARSQLAVSFRRIDSVLPRLMRMNRELRPIRSRQKGLWTLARRGTARIGVFSDNGCETAFAESTDARDA